MKAALSFIHPSSLRPHPFLNPLLLACGGANIAPNPSSTVRTKLVPGDFSKYKFFPALSLAELY